MATSESECLQALRTAAAELGESPTKAQYEALGLQPSASTILRVVGGWNEAKARAELPTEPSTGSRVQPKPDDVRIPEGERWEDLSQDQRWHYRNVEWNTQRTLERRERLRAWLFDRRDASGGCVRCGVSDARCLDFHHIDPSSKTGAINELVLYGYGRESIREELEDCEVLCANCHRREHSSLSGLGEELDGDHEGRVTADSSLPRTRPEIRAWAREYRAERGCGDCGKRDPRYLVSHHPEGVENSDGVGALIANGRSFEAVRRELRRCTTLCANCHRKRHVTDPRPVPQSDSV